MRPAVLKLPSTSYEELRCDESTEGEDIVWHFRRTNQSDPFQVVQLLRDIGAPRLLICPVCRNAFIPSRQDQRYCGPRCTKIIHDRRQKSPHKLIAHKARSEERAKHDVHFCALDGEGVSRYDADGNVLEHIYALLGATGCSPLHKDGQRLTTADIFHHLYYVVFTQTEKLHPGTCYIGFSLGYDWAQWFRDLPVHQARLLFTREGIASRQSRYENAAPHPVHWRVSDELEWEFDILGDKRFRLRPYTGPRRITYKTDEFPDYRPPQWMYICDAVSYFQTSFLKVIDPEIRLKLGLKPYVIEAEYLEIEKGKDRRADAQFDRDMIRYNELENKGLTAVMAEMNRGLVKNNLRLRKTQYFGPRTSRSALALAIG